MIFTKKKYFMVLWVRLAPLRITPMNKYFI